ncbi:MAG: murein biosynthesis integral membrane protein MurJ, partial [Planctomycetota bacterium]
GSFILDSFTVANALPNLLRNLFGEGALSAAVVPRYVQLKQQDPEAAERFVGAIVTRLALALSALCAVAMASAVAIMSTTAGNSQAYLVAALSLPMLPFAIFVCTSAIMAGVLNGRRHFWVPAFTPVVLNVALISTVWAAPEDECWLLPYAVLVSGLVGTVLHLWALRRSGVIPPVVFRVRADERERLSELWSSLIPTTLSAGVFQLNAFFDNIIALAAGAGGPQVLYFASRLFQFPLALVGHGVSIAVYPELSASASGGWPAISEGLREALSTLWFWLLPAAIGLLVVAEPAVRAIYQVGQFNEELVGRTVLALRFFALALIPLALSRVMVRAFFACRDQATPLKISVATVVANLALNLVLVRTDLREAGLALSTAITGMVACIVYIVLLRRRGVHGWCGLSQLARPLIAATAMGAAVGTLLWYWPQPVGHASGVAALRLGVAVGLGALVYLGIAGRGWLQRSRPTT